MADYTIHINPKVKRVIQSFQSAAVRTLSGPNGIPMRSGSLFGCQSKINATEAEEYHKSVSGGKKVIEEKIVKYENPFLSSPPFPRQKMPVFGGPVDSTRSEQTDTLLEGETIACFTVGGEKRLCLPQILNTVLRDFTLQQINCVCEDLNIFCSRCNKIQLEVLKMMSILPSSAPSCGLITKTDAERLCSALLHGNPERSMEPPSRNSFKVYHECFGKCKGVFNSDVYTSPDSKCIRCVDCFGMFAPSKFVCHSHKSLENRTCHWGFDSENWRYYLLLSKDQNLQSSMKLHDAIEEIKSRFDPSHKQKRRQSPELSSRTEPSNSKRIKSDSNTDAPSGAVISSSAQISKWEALSLRQLSAFYPWSPYLLSAIKEGKLLPPPAIMGDQLAGILPSNLHTGPPVLLDPERVIPYSESERYGRHFTPNISLAPSSSSQRSSPDEDEQEVKNKQVSSQASTNRSHLSEMSNHKAQNGSCKGEGGRKKSADCDVQTDTDDSSHASPTDSCKDVNLSTVPAYKSTLQQEMNMIRSLLDGKMSPSPETHSHFLQEFSRLRAKTEETVQWLLRVHRVLKQELGSSQRQKLELYKLLTKAERDMKGLAVEKEYALKEARLQKQQTQSRTHSKFDQELESRRKNIESVYRKVCKENHNLQRELSVMSESSSSVKFSEDAHRSFQSRLKMVLDLTASDAGKRKQILDTDSRREQSITVD